MEFFKRKFKISCQMIVMVATLFLMSAIVFPTNSNAEITNDPETDYLDSASPIVIEFDKPIEFDTGIMVHPAGGGTPFPTTGGTGPLPTGSSYGTFPGFIEVTQDTLIIDIRLEVSGNKLKIYPSPSGKWDINKDYTIKITDHIVKEFGLINEVLPSDITLTAVEYEIGTYFLTFEELMSGSRKINTIIRNYTPRKINVTAPKRYLDEVSIIHKRQDLVQGSTTESVTNVDISIKDPSGDVKRIAVTPKMNGSALQITKTFIPDARRTPYDFGFTRLPDTSAFDFEVILYDVNDEPLDIRTVKVPFESSTTTTIKQRDRYRFADKTLTLYQLLDKPNDLQTLLDENRMDEIKVRVVQN